MTVLRMSVAFLLFIEKTCFSNGFKPRFAEFAPWGRESFGAQAVQKGKHTPQQAVLLSLQKPEYQELFPAETGK